MSLDEPAHRPDNAKQREPMTRPVRKLSSPSSPKLELPRPKLVPLRLDQIIPYTTDPEFEWVRNLHHLPMSSPTLEPEAVPLLALCQPLVVSRNPQAGPKTDAGPIAKPTYRLLAGFRTFQLLMEGAASSKIRVWALELPKPGKGIAYEVFDAITTKLLLSPNAADLALIGAIAQDRKEIRGALERQLPARTDDQLAAQLGMSYAKLFRVTKPVRKALRDSSQHRELTEKVGLEFELPTEAKARDEQG